MPHVLDVIPRFPDSLDSTMLSAYTDCPQKFFMEYVLKLAPSGTSPDLHAGGAMAAGFEAARSAFYFHGKNETDAIAEGFAAFAKYWGSYEPPEDHAKTFISCGYALTEYFHKYPLATDYLQPYRGKDDAPAVEFTFAMPTEVRHPITGDPILYSGRCDLVAHMRNKNDELAVVDEKTTKYLGDTFFRKWGMRGQFYGYAYSFERLTGNIVDYALVRGIGLQKTDTKFAEVLVPLPQWRKDRWWRATNNKIREIVGRFNFMMQERRDMESRLEQAEDMSKVEKANQVNSVSHAPWTFAFGEPCEQFGGCPFKQNCLRQFPHMFYSDYDSRNWNPLAKDPTEGNVNSLEMLDSITLPPDAMPLIGRSG